MPFLIQNVIKIALFKGEEKIACVLVACYDAYIDESMVFKAIEKEQYLWM